jgi:hypothetical protein
MKNYQLKMKRLLLAALMVAAMWGCKKDDQEPMEEEVVNYLAETKWQSYIPIGDKDMMFAKYLIFNKDETCNFIDSIGISVTVKKYYYDPINGESFKGMYYTNIYYDEDKKNIYETISIKESLDRIFYYWILGKMASVVYYKRIE